MANSFDVQIQIELTNALSTARMQNACIDANLRGTWDS